MSTGVTVLYRCPSCSAAVDSGTRSCSSCGHKPSVDERTWLVEGDLAPAGKTADRERGPQGRFDGRYRLLEEVGRGGMGIVYKAVDKELDEVIALKVLAPAAGAHPELVTRFKHELKVTRRLTHPNIARLHDLIEFRGQLCLSMEFIEGQSLREVLERAGRFTPERVLAYLRCFVPALELAHSMGVVHRDLKPQNVIVDHDDVPHILDFGIAKSRWLQEENDGTPIGTPAYMAPEQCAEGVEVDGRADLYSLGVILYELATGKKPFEHRNRLILIEMHRTKSPPPPRSLVPELPEDIEAVILKLLAKAPAQRFARAADVLAAIDRPTMSMPAPLLPPAEASAQPIAAPVAPAVERKTRVLVADHDDEARRALAQQMRAQGVVVLEASDGVQALEVTYRELPDLILLDIDMPTLDGLEVLRLLQNEPRTKAIPTVVMSEEREAGQVAFSKDHGARSFLAKPITSEVLELLLERYLG